MIDAILAAKRWLANNHEVCEAERVAGYGLSASSSTLASFRSGVSKPSVNQP